MTKVLDDALLARAAQDAARALAARDPDTLAGRVSPRPAPAETTRRGAAEDPTKHAARS